MSSTTPSNGDELELEAGESVTEDPSPGTGPIWTENELPGTGPIYQERFNQDEHDAKTRRMLATISIVILAVFYLLPSIAVIIGALDVEEAAKLMGALAPLQTLVAVAFGFYFATASKK